MLQQKIYALIFGLLLQSQFSFAQTNAADSVAVARLSQQKFDWMVRMSLDSLANILDEQLMYIHSNGWVQNKAEVLADFRSKKLQMNNVVSDSVRVRFFANTAILTASGFFNITYLGKLMELKLKFTEVYVKKNKKWWLVSRHANKL
jgi:hypothetical protein